LRKQRDALIDPKYDGVKTSRSRLYEFDDGTDEELISPPGSASEGELNEESGHAGKHNGGVVWIE
jgi:hypothetical protein